MRTPILMLLAISATLALLAFGSTCAGDVDVAAAGVATVQGLVPGEVHGPGPAPVDLFHPDRRPDANGRLPELPPPTRGGRVVVHIDRMPPSLCVPIENSANAGRILREAHESLMTEDWETWEWKPSLATRRVVEDTLVLERGERLFGTVAEVGDHYELTTAGGQGTDVRKIAADEVRSVERATVYTYTLRDALWHPVEGLGDQRLDARDVAFSFSIYANPRVRCDEKRYQFDGISCEVLGERAVRFVYDKQYFRGDLAVGSMTILPSHLYDLTDPDNPDYDPEATLERRARHVNESPHNRMWIGLGPYRIVEFGAQHIEAERFDGYYDPANGGYLDRIRWREIGDAAVFQALLEGELDFTARLSSPDYFGRATEEPFTEHYYRGNFVRGMYTAIVWNVQRKELSDPDVRRAIAHSFDVDGFRRSYYKGLAYTVAGPMPFFSQAYDRTVEPLAYDPRRAEKLLDEAGWYDRDGDGFRDKDGAPLAIEYTMPAGSVSSRMLGLKLQEDLGRVGIDVSILELDWAAFRERQKKRDFDGTPTAWYQPLEPDPEQVWHSQWGAPGVESANYSGLQNASVDILIERGQHEIDASSRMEIWNELHRRIYDLQPFLFLYNVPVRFAMNRRIRGFQSVKIDPGYVIRRWYYAE